MVEEEIEKKRVPRGFFARASFMIRDAVWFKEFLNTVTRTGIDPMVDIKMNGLGLRMMEERGIYMWDVWFSSNFFLFYKCSRSGRRCIPFKDVLEVALKSVKKDSKVEFIINGKKDLLLVKADDRISREYEFSLTEEQEEPAPLPNISFAAAYTFNLKALHYDLKIISNSGYEYVVFSGNKKTFFLEAENDDFTHHSKRVKFTYNVKEKSGLIECKVKKKSVSKYNVNTLLEILNPKISDFVTLRYSSNMPIKIEYIINDKDKDSKIDCYLAPVVMIEE